jgi:hypothetical protein
MRHIVIAFGLITLLSGCGSVVKKLTAGELDHYMALRVWMSEADTKAYSKLKTAEERNTYLQESGYWDRFYQYDKKRREQIIAGEVAKGWMQDQVYMSWGAPHLRKRLAGRRAVRSEMFVYRFEIDPDGSVYVWEPKSKQTYYAVGKYQIDLTVDDGLVVDMVRKDNWE